MPSCRHHPAAAVPRTGANAAACLRPAPRRSVGTPLLRLAACLLAAGAAAPSLAETNPWYLGISENISHDSNLYRLRDGQQPAGIASRGDTVLSTALIGGIDKPFGRQRLRGSASLRNNRYQNNGGLSFNGYGTDLALDWATIERVSGTAFVNLDRSLRRFDSAESNTLERNVVTSTTLGLTARVGVVTRLTAEAGVQHNRVSYSAAAYRGWGYRSNQINAGLRWQLGGALTLGIGPRISRLNYDAGGGYNRRDLDLTASWVPRGSSRLNARVSLTNVGYDSGKGRDYSGTTWELRGTTQPTGKLTFGAAIWRDTGLAYSTYLVGPIGGVADFNRSTDTLRLTADYAVSAKVSANAALQWSRRDLSTVLGGVLPLGGSDTTTQASLGARWAPTRALLFGCNLAHEQRSASSQVSSPYTSNTFGCYGQATIQ